MPPQRGLATAFDRLIVLTDLRTLEAGPLPDGYCAPRDGGWSRIEHLELQAVKEEQMRKSVGVRLPEKSCSEQVKTARPTHAATKKALASLGMTVNVDRNAQTPTETDLSGSNYSEAMDDDDTETEEEAEEAEGRSYKVPKGTKYNIRLQPAASPLASKSKVKKPLMLPTHQNDIFSEVVTAKTPKRPAGRPPKERKEDCINARVDIEGIVGRLAEKWKQPFEVMWKECDLAVTATPLRTPSLWQRWLQVEKADRGEDEDGKYLSVASIPKLTICYRYKLHEAQGCRIP